MISVTDALSLLSYTRDEERAIDKLEAAIDAALADPVKFTGGTLSLAFIDEISPKVANAIRRKYESEGNWRIQVEQGAAPPGGPKTTKFSLMPIYFTPATLKRPGAAESKLPPLPQAAPQAQATPGKRILVRMPTRGRARQALQVLEKYRTMAGMPIQIEVVVDDNDASMQQADVLQRLVALGCTVTSGCHRNKVEACNGGRLSEWDILVLASDDMVPLVDGYAQRIQAAMDRHFPYLDGALHFDDGYQGSNLCTLPIFGRRLYQQFGYVYDPAYVSLFCDTEQTDLFRRMKRLAYVDERLIQHRHPAFGAAPRDELYQKNDSFWTRDQGVYELRKKTYRPGAQFPFNAPPLLLSLCICTIPERRPQLDRLLDEIWRQILENSAWEEPRSTEVLLDDRTALTIGQKRQALLERAQGDYVAFIDDDDWIAPFYLARTLIAIATNRDVDCLSLVGQMTTAGAAVERFEHSIQHREWSDREGVHYRSPNHLNAVRRSLALQAGFPAKNHAEDFDYSRRLREILKTEASPGPEPMYYYWYMPKATPEGK